jgi:hypothetical protein
MALHWRIFPWMIDADLIAVDANEMLSHEP